MSLYNGVRSLPIFEALNWMKRKPIKSTRDIKLQLSKAAACMKQIKKRGTADSQSAYWKNKACAHN